MSGASAPSARNAVSTQNTRSLPTSSVAVVGDNRYDLEAARAAGAWAVLYTGGREHKAPEYAALAHVTIDSFDPPHALLAWLAEPT